MFLFVYYVRLFFNIRYLFVCYCFSHDWLSTASSRMKPQTKNITGLLVHIFNWVKYGRQIVIKNPTEIWE